MTQSSIKSVRIDDEGRALLHVAQGEGIVVWAVKGTEPRCPPAYLDPTAEDAQRRIADLVIRGFPELVEPAPALAQETAMLAAELVLTHHGLTREA